MEEEGEFIDYYSVLEVAPGCSEKGLELAYHELAKRYHPDNRQTADVDKFSEILAAYRVLRDPVRRSDYDQRYFPGHSGTSSASNLRFDEALDEQTAVNDAEMHGRILLHLYKRRRQRPMDAGVIQWLLQETLGCSEDEIDFHIWYLRSKGFVEVTESSGLAITIAGVDEVIAQSRKGQAEKLLLTQTVYPDQDGSED